MDSSAWVALYRAEEDRTFLIRTILATMSWQVAGTRLVQVETERNLALRAGDTTQAELHLEDFRHAWQGVEQIDIDDDTWELARQLAITTRLRAPDAIHLAALERLGVQGALLLTFDRALAQAAHDRGFGVVGGAI
ncbi:MAG: type II toxin-antitoxin system VapC family toxin [Thermoleophilia bacterium]|nr:type II toxin-antitoxin system VapC family toxin [Thermoleophilia bacterium]